MAATVIPSCERFRRGADLDQRIVDADVAGMVRE
jgi:hypothetical protein